MHNFDAITRALSSGSTTQCERAFDALRLLPHDVQRTWLEAPLKLLTLKGGAVELHSSVSTHRIFRRRHTRMSNVLSVLRLGGRLEGLERLELMVMPLTALYPLAGLAQLRSLTVLGDPDFLLDLSPLSRLRALTVLELQRAQVMDLQPLVGLKKLQTLAIRESSSLVDARPLLAMPGLARLDLGGCGSLRPRCERSMMPDAGAVRRYRMTIARSLKRAGSKTASERRWLKAAEAEGLLRRVAKDTSLLSGMKPLTQLLKSRDPAIAEQGLELLKALTGEEVARLGSDEAMLRGLLSAPSPAVRRLGIRLLLEHASPEHARGLADGISLDDAGQVVLRPGVGRRGYLRGSKGDPSTVLALLRIAGRLDGVSEISFVDGQAITTAVGLTGLSALKSLHMNPEQTPEGTLRVMEELTGLTQLESLQIHSAAHLESLHALRHMPTLQSLTLHNTSRLRDLNGLDAFQSLRLLAIRSARQLQDLGGLAGASALEELVLYIAPRLSDLSPLSALRSLRTLTLVGCSGVTDLSPLAALSRLETLELRGLDGVEDIAPLADLTALKTLTLQCGPISVLSPLAGLTRLESLSLTHTTGQLPPLDGLTQLSDLFLSRAAGLDTLASLSGLCSLERLRIRLAPITTLDGLAGLAALQAVSVKGCPALSDISALSSLPVLSRLDIEGSPALSDLSSLRACGELRALVLSDLGIRTPYSTFGREEVTKTIAWMLRSVD